MVCIRVISLCHLHTIQRVLFEIEEEKNKDLGKVGFSIFVKSLKRFVSLVISLCHLPASRWN